MYLTLLFLCLPAHAGHYNASYMGTLKVDGQSQTVSPSSTNFSQSFSGCHQTATATVTATLTWAQDGAQDTSLPPDNICVVESADAGGSGSGVVGASATADDGFGDTPVPTSTPIYSNGVVVGTQFSTDCKGGHALNGQSGSPITLPTRTMTVTYSGGGSGGGAFGYAVGAVYIQTSGTIPYSGMDEVLTGQQVTATLNNGSPYSIKAGTRLAWKFNSGSNFKDYNTGNTNNDQLVNLNSTTDANGNNDYNQSQFQFYTKKNETVQIQCTATLNAPDPAPNGTDISITVTKKIKSVKPNVTKWSIESGWVHQNGTTFGLYGLAGSAYPNGQSWHDISINVPNPFSRGTFCFAQLITPDRKVYRQLVAGSTASSFYQVQNNGVQGLDNSFKYNNQSWAIPNQPATVELSGDSPAISVGSVPNATDGGGNNWNKFVNNDSLTTWLMYMPSGGVWIPLQSYTWSYSATVELMPGPPPDWELTSGTTRKPIFGTKI